MAELPPMLQKDAPKTLFQLQREGWISVDVHPPAELAVVGDLQQSVRALAEHGARAAVLTDQDGLVLAYAGAVPLSTIDHLGEAAMDWQGDGGAWQLPLGEGSARHCYRLAVSRSAQLEPAALVALARRLVRLRARGLREAH
ncbi:MAG: hypothetical protein C4K60_14860 [Ideonella sp. MAG2]|nr:MAG: hypothetical protein C4K60_14860 [Ideonella sp. MAG2]